MYVNYFGLKEPGFSITPDPQYLFLSGQHREALAHLLYGASESGGFVLLTGEVGTGKTTVCRAFLEQLPEHVDVALILNPALTSTELLQAVCDEFRLALPEGEHSAKYLIDRLNRYLLEAHAQGRRPVLMIDEAQSLGPQVLEQIRLLTNLETPKHKLLQIFLIGQPELRELLRQPGLRQIDQRITARYHLQPFSARDTLSYVRHRLAVAGTDRPLFALSAVRRIHRLTGGVPRLINILCDRALLGASVTRRPMVTRAIVERAAAEVQDRGSWRKTLGAPARAALALVLLLIALGGFGIAWERIGGEPGWHALTSPLPPRLAAALRFEDPFRGVEAPDPTPAPAADRALDPETVGLDQAEAMRLLLRRWSVELGNLDGEAPCARVKRFGLSCEHDEGGWSRLRDFDRPALLRLNDPEGRERYAVLGALRDDQAILDVPGGRRTLPLARLDPLWSGHYLLVWQPPPVGTLVIGSGASSQAVRWLRQLLSEVEGLAFEATDSGRFDAELAQAVRRFQTQAGLNADGIAGPRTLIRLHNAVNMPGPPRLREAD